MYGRHLVSTERESQRKPESFTARTRFPRSLCCTDEPVHVSLGAGQSLKVIWEPSSVSINCNCKKHRVFSSDKMYTFNLKKRSYYSLTTLAGITYLPLPPPLPSPPFLLPTHTLPVPGASFQVVNLCFVFSL